jgi:biotin carboxyl carrier protein
MKKNITFNSKHIQWFLFLCLSFSITFCMFLLSSCSDDDHEEVNNQAHYQDVPASLLTDAKKLEMVRSIQDLKDGRFFYLDYTEDYKLSTISGYNLTDNTQLIGAVLKTLCDKTPSWLKARVKLDAGCSAFAVTTPDTGDYLMGRNFDYSHDNEPIAAALVRTAPEGGLKSISMVDAYWIGYRQDLWHYILYNKEQFEKHKTSASIYQASIDEINVRLAKLAKDCERYRNLVEKKAATPIQLEQLEVEYAATRKKLEGVKKQQAAAYKGVNEVTTRKQNVAASIERAEAAVEMAKLNLSYCVVVAPCDGKLGRRSIEEGQMVNAGTTITYIIPTNNKWVIANYKETQIENLYVGQKVRMTVDAISNKEFEGTVTAISGATGSKYSLVPTDNSAGNFVKIQQRVPVRIDFNNLSKEDNEHLAAGMMVVVKAERK